MNSQMVTLKEGVKIANKSEKQLRRMYKEGRLLGTKVKWKIMINLLSLKELYWENKNESEELTKTEKVLTGSTKKMDELYFKNMELQEENKKFLKLLNSWKDEKIEYEKNTVKYKGIILFLCFFILIITGTLTILYKTKIMTFS